MGLLLSDNEVNRAIGADETGLMLRVMHANIRHRGEHRTERFGIIYHKTFVFFRWRTLDPG